MTNERSEHFYEPRLGHGLRHDPFNSIVGPPRIGLISTRPAHGGLHPAPLRFLQGFHVFSAAVGFFVGGGGECGVGVRTGR